MASTAGEAPSTGFDALQTRAKGHAVALHNRLELWLEAERAQLPLWLPVLLGTGIGCWFAFPTRPMWLALLALGAGLVGLGLVLGRHRRTGLALVWAGLMLALGCALIWWRAERVAGPVIARPVITTVRGDILSAEWIIARDSWRLLIAPDPELGLPGRIRLTVPRARLATAPPRASLIVVRARLMPPPEPSLPNGYDFRRPAWFAGVGAVGKAIDVPRLSSSQRPPRLRDRLNSTILRHLPDREAGIAMALATGEEGHIAAADQQAMRLSGLAHLLSVSGLHISAAVGAAFFLTLRVLALSRTLALRTPLLLVAALAGAAAGIGYTLLTGAQVPTVRSCIAALLVLAALALGRDALTLRLVAAGALAVLLIWPDALIGASFQLSFAAIIAIMALHESPRVAGWFARREEGLVRRAGRLFGALLLTGIVVEVALAPIALYHFHKAGIYGALANLVGIPLTTFIIMPAEALALLLEPIGLSAPFWDVTGRAIAALLWIAHAVARWPGATALLPVLPLPAFLLLIAGGLWVALWRTPCRWLGLAPLFGGLVWALLTPGPDLLVTHDGRHLALRDDAGQWAILRPRSRDFIRQALSERAAFSGDFADLDRAQGGRCSADACLVDLERGKRRWRVMAIRSSHYLDWAAMMMACQSADIIISPRRLPKDCRARWLAIDPQLLAQTGGLAISLAPVRLETARLARDDHPWARTHPALQTAPASRDRPGNQ